MVWVQLHQLWPLKYSWIRIIISSFSGNHSVLLTQKTLTHLFVPFSLNLGQPGVYVSTVLSVYTALETKWPHIFLRPPSSESSDSVIGCYQLFSSSCSGTATRVLGDDKNWRSPGEKRPSASGHLVHCSVLLQCTVLCVADGNSSVKPIFML